MRLFEGREVEGRFTGLWTLFVSGDVPHDRIIWYLRTGNYHQVYFGADNCSEINISTVDKLLGVGLVDIVTVELGDNYTRYLPDHRQLHYMLNVQKLTKLEISTILSSSRTENVQIKFTSDNRCYVAPAICFFSNLRTAIHADTELWKGESETVPQGR
jgi:hypothetical protein